MQENSVGASWLEGAPNWGKYRSHQKKERLGLGWPSFSPLRNDRTSEQAEETGGSFRHKRMKKTEEELIPILDASTQFIYKK